MGRKYLNDTNAVIEYLNNTLPDETAYLIENTRPLISVITRIEMPAWPKLTDIQIVPVNSFINASVVINLEEEIIIKAIYIRKNYRLKLPDAVIAATALVHNLTLIYQECS